LGSRYARKKGAHGEGRVKSQQEESAEIIFGKGKERKDSIRSRVEEGELIAFST